MKLKIIPTLYVAVGLPASGKSFWWEQALSKKLLPPTDSKRIQIDLIRSDLCGDINDHTQDSIVEKVAISNLKTYLIKNIPIIYYDDLNLDRSKRIKIGNIAKEFNYKTCAIIFNTNTDLCMNRLKGSHKKISIDLMEEYSKMYKDFPVDYDEGWDDILISI